MQLQLHDSSKLHYLPKVHLQIPSHAELGLQHMNVEATHSVHTTEEDAGDRVHTGCAVSKTLSGPWQSLALPGPHTPPCQVPCVYSGPMTVPGSTEARALPAVWSHNQTS